MAEQETAPTEGTEETTEPEGFKAIASQEELNKIVESRLARERAKYADYDELKSAKTELDKIKDSQKTDQQKSADLIANLQKELGGYKQRDQVNAWATGIVKDSTIPANALRGSTREELEEHFSQLESLVVQAKPKPKAVPSGKSPEDREKPTNAAAALRQLRKG